MSTAIPQLEGSTSATLKEVAQQLLNHIFTITIFSVIAKKVVPQLQICKHNLNFLLSTT
jgi:hypothetical protein